MVVSCPGLCCPDGGPQDLGAARQLDQVIAVVTGDGFSRLSEAEAEAHARAVVDERMQSPDGPKAPLSSG